MTLAVITARFESSRLPGKLLLPLCGRPVLDWILERLRKAKNVDSICLATPVRNQSALWAWADKHEIPVTLGPEEDVLQRMCLAARENGATKVLRITGDLPFLSYEGVDLMIGALKPKIDYVNNFYTDHPWLDGTSAEVAWNDSLHVARRLTPFGEAHEVHAVHGGVQGSWRSHGMYWMANSPHFTHAFVGSDIDVAGLPHLLLDESVDLRVAEFVMGKVLRKDDTYPTLVQIVRENQKEIERIRGA